MTTPSTAFSRRAFLGGGTALAALGALALAGCTTTAPPGAGATNAPTKAKTINFYGNSLGEDAQKVAWQAVVDGYSKESGVKVAPVIYPYDQAATQLALTGRSGKLMGVGQSGGWQVLTPMDVLADLSDLAKGLGIPQGVLDSYTMDGKLLVLPLTAAGIGIITNGEIAKSVGIKSGMTVEQFATALEKIKSQDASLIPYAAVTKNPDLKDGAHWMWGFGSEVVTDDFECTIGDAESVEAITWYKSLQDAGLTQPNVARSDARILFASGRTALYDDAPLASTFVKTNGAAQNVIDNINAIARPTADGKPSYNRAWGGGLFATRRRGRAHEPRLHHLRGDRTSTPRRRSTSSRRSRRRRSRSPTRSRRSPPTSSRPRSAPRCRSTPAAPRGTAFPSPRRSTPRSVRASRTSSRARSTCSRASTR